MRPPVRMRTSLTNASVFTAVRLPGTTLTTRRCVGVEGDVIPVVPLFAVRRIAGIAVFLLFPHKGPFLVELHLTRLRRKRDQHIMQVLGMFACQQTLPAHRLPVAPS